MLKKSESELVKRVFLAQTQFPTKKDWYSEVKDTLTLCGINLTEEEISRCSAFKFKNLVNSKVRQKASDDLTMLQMKHSKTKYLYQSDEMKEYLRSEELMTTEKK